MTTATYRLKDSTAVEPLVNLWPAWSHVLAPVASSLHLKNYQINVLQAYLKDPSVHVRACQDPKLRSGRFVEIPVERASEVGEFLKATEVKQGPNLKLAKSLIDFHNYLVSEANGESLDPFYAKLPEELRGYVELIYDYYHRPTVRVLENLLYESPYYNPSLQSLRLFEQKKDNSRSFVMSTPRLPSPDQIDLVVPFKSDLLDELFKLDSAPQPFEYIRNLLDVGEEESGLLMELLTDEPLPAPAKWEGATARIRYFGHACVLVEHNGVSILTDPCLGVIPSQGGMDRFSYHDLPQIIDYVLVTHNHHDHFSIETLLRLRHKIGCLVVPRSFGILYGDLSLKFLSKKLGFKNVVELDTLESTPFSGGEIVGVPFLGEHADLPHGKTAYVIRAGDEQMLFAADSDCLDVRMYQHVVRSVGSIGTVFLGMECVGAPLSWSCGSFLPVPLERRIDESRRFKGCDADRAMRILRAVKAERVFIYAMGLEPWLEHLLGLAYTEDSLQLKEAHKLLRLAPDAASTDARLLAGKAEIHLSDLPGRETQAGATRQPWTSSAGQVFPASLITEESGAERSDGQLESWCEQQFSFD